MNIKRYFLALIFAFSFLNLALPTPLSAQTMQGQTGTKIVVSIPPFYAITSELLRGIQQPVLIVKQGASPHHYALSPKEVQALTSADVIIWGGPYLESFLINALKNVPSTTDIVQLDKTAGIHWLNARTSPLFKDIPNTRDMHFWLDPDNALIITEAIKNKLLKIFPQHQAQLNHNAQKLKKDIQAMDAKLKHKLKPVKKMPYLVMHDGYHYFEHHYGLNAIGSITDHPEYPLNMARVKEVKNIIRTKHVVCIFSEPGVRSKFMDALVKEYGLRTGVLDSLERPNEKGEYSYPQALEGLADAILDCLQKQSQK